MNKFIRVENTILITDNIEAVYPNYRIVKYGGEWCGGCYDENEKVEDGVVVVVMTNNPQPYVFTSISLGEFMGLLNGY